MSPDDNNEELRRLLSQFGLKDASRGAIRAAQNAFYDLLHEKLEKYAQRMVNYHEELAIVAVQEAWLKIARSAHQYNPALATVETWAKRIIFQCAMDQLRAYYARQKLVDTEQDWSTAIDNATLNGNLDEIPFSCRIPDGEDVVYTKQMREAIVHCIAQLPCDNGPNYRLVMQLCLDSDLNYAGLKDALAAQSPRHNAISAEHVRGWIRQAQAKMKGCLNLKLGWNQAGRPT